MTKYTAFTAVLFAFIIVMGAAVSLASAATGTFSLSVTCGSAGTATKASAGSNSGWHGGATVTLKWDDGVTVLGSASTNGAGKWSADITVPSSANAGTHTITADDGQGTTGTATFTVTVSAVTMTVSYHVNDATTPSSAPVFHYKDTNGASKTYTLTPSAHSVMDVGAGLAWSVDNPIGSSYERWATTTTVGNAPASGSSTITFNYYHQYQVTFQYSIANSAGSGYSNPVVSYSQFGTSGHTATALEASGPSDWVDAASSITYPGTLTGSGATEQWITQTTSIPATSGTITAAYYHQVRVTFDASTNVKADSSDTIVTVGGSAKTAQTLPFTSDWINSGDSLTYSYQGTVASSSSPSTQYSWGSTSGLSQTSQAATFTVTAPGTITANFQSQTQQVQTQISIMYIPANPNEPTALNGKLTLASDTTVGVPNKEIILSYFDGENWNIITTTTTGADGSYSFQWSLPADIPNGPQMVKATFSGDPQGASPQYMGSESVSNGIGIYVLPEYSLGGIVAFAMAFGAFAVFWVHKNHKPKLPSRH